MSAKDTRIAELEKSNRTMQTEHDAGLTAKTAAEVQVVVHKILAESTRTSLEVADQTIFQLRGDLMLQRLANHQLQTS